MLNVHSPWMNYAPLLWDGSNNSTWRTGHLHLLEKREVWCVCYRYCYLVWPGGSMGSSMTGTWVVCSGGWPPAPSCPWCSCQNTWCKQYWCGLVIRLLVQITFQNHISIWCNSLSPLWLYKPENLASEDFNQWELESRVDSLTSWPVELSTS